jgi:AcrR family transcriptional regulator
MTYDPQRERRELRLKIGRLRRRIDARIRTTQTEGRKLASWQNYVARYPGTAILAAFGLGLSGATLFSSGRLLKGLGRGILQGSADRAIKLAWRELRRHWPSDGGQS